MDIINSKRSIRIHFMGLQQKERVVFDRVITFNKTHGLEAQDCEDITSANLVVVTESALSEVEVIKDKAVLLVITKETTLGDVQVASPLLVTRVMKALTRAIQLANDKPEVSEALPVNTQHVVTAETTTQVTEPSLKAQAETEGVQQAGHHALVIDDSAAIRKQLELELRDAGMTADFAESGEQALEKIKEGRFDLIFLDIVMPGIDGYETCQLIRKNEAYKKVPIIMLSGKTSPLDEVQGIMAGASTYLAKPVKSDKFQETLGRLSKWLNSFSEIEKKKESAVV